MENGNSIQWKLEKSGNFYCCSYYVDSFSIPNSLFQMVNVNNAAQPCANVTLLRLHPFSTLHSPPNSIPTIVYIIKYTNENHLELNLTGWIQRVDVEN